MPVRRAGPRRVDTPPFRHAEFSALMSDPETPLDPEKWERWTAPHRPPLTSSYRDAVVKLLEERDFACRALGFDPDPDVARRAAAILAEKADRTADWYLHGTVGSGTGIPADPAALVAWRAKQAGPCEDEAEFWRARLGEIDGGP